MQGELVAKLRELVDQLPAMAWRDGPLAAMPQVGQKRPQFLVDLLDFLQEGGVDGDGTRRGNDGHNYLRGLAWRDKTGRDKPHAGRWHNWQKSGAPGRQPVSVG